MNKLLAIVLILTCLLIVGCSGSMAERDESAELQDQISQMQEELDALKPENEVSTSAEIDTAPAADSGTKAEDKVVAPEPNTDPSYTKNSDSYDMTGLEAVVDDVVAKVDSAAATGNSSTDRATFRNLHSELETAEREVDIMEDTIEADVRSGVLSREDYRTLDSQIDVLENRLDRAEDTLEFTFEVDD